MPAGRGAHPAAPDTGAAGDRSLRGFLSADASGFGWVGAGVALCVCRAGWSLRSQAARQTQPPSCQSRTPSATLRVIAPDTQAYAPCLPWLLGRAGVALRPCRSHHRHLTSIALAGAPPPPRPRALRVPLRRAVSVLAVTRCGMIAARLSREVSLVAVGSLRSFWSAVAALPLALRWQIIVALRSCLRCRSSTIVRGVFIFLHCRALYYSCGGLGQP